MDERNDLLDQGILLSVIQDVLKRWMLCATVALIAAMAAFIFTDWSYRPQYSTVTTFVVSSSDTSGNTYSNLSAASEAAAVFTEILNSSLLRAKVQEQMGISYFDGSVSSSVIEGTNLLTMTVRGSDPRTVFLMSRAIIDHHEVVSGTVLQGKVLEILQNPTVPTAPNNPLNRRSAILKAAVWAACAMAVLLGGLSLTSDRIRSRDEADRKLACRVLGELSHERKRKRLSDRIHRRKRGLLISDPLVSFHYTESIHKLASRILRRLKQEERTVLVTSLMENEGKSTVAVNLALSMARKGRKVLLIDGDLRKPSCCLILEQNGERAGTADVLRDKISLTDAITNIPGTTLWLLSNRKSLRSATNLCSSEAMARLLAEAKTMFDYVVIDTPPMSLTPDAECICTFADAAVLVARQNIAPAKLLNESAEILARNGAHMLGCILNNVYHTGNYAPTFGYGYGYGYGRYGKYGKYGKYGYGRYDKYGQSSHGKEAE